VAKNCKPPTENWQLERMDYQEKFICSLNFRLRTPDLGPIKTIKLNTNMSGASLIFWIVCAVPLIGLLYWLIRKDKNKLKGSWGVIILGVLVIAALLVIVYVTKDFSAIFSQN